MLHEKGSCSKYVLDPAGEKIKMQQNSSTLYKTVYKCRVPPQPMPAHVYSRSCQGVQYAVFPALCYCSWNQPLPLAGSALGEQLKGMSSY